MNKKEIREAYDRMNPPRETKERMMQNLLNKTCKRRSSNAEPVRYSRWSVVPAAMALVAVLAVGAFVLKPQQNVGPLASEVETTTPSEVNVSEPTENSKTVYAVSKIPGEIHPQYREILEKYQTAIVENWTKERWMQSDISYEMFAEEDLLNCGYALLDLDRSGVEELLITNGDQIYELYTILGSGEREKASKLIARTDVRFSMQLCEDKYLKTVESGDRYGGTYYTYYKLSHDGLGAVTTVVQEIVFVTSENVWYAGPSEKEAVPVTVDQAQVMIDEYQVLNFDKDYFVETLAVETAMPEGYEHILNKYVTAIEENWGGEQYMEHDMSYALVNFDSPEQYGYTLLDIDGNGREELLITDGTYLYDVYTQLEDDRGPGHLISGGERLRYFLCEDGIIGYQGSGSAFNTIWQFYRLENGMDLIPVQTLTLGTDVWHAGITEDDAVEITHAEAQKILDKYRAREIDFLPMTAISG